MIITYSSIAAFKSCRRHYQYRYVDNLEQKDRPLYFDFGTAVHLALAYHYNGVPVNEITIAIEDYFTENAPAQDDAERLQKWIEARDLAVAMYLQYAKRYPQESFKVEAIEKEFELPIIDVRGDPYPGLKLAGKVDGVVEENGLWVLEHKTASTIDVRYKRKLTLDAQSMIYLEAMERVYGQKFNGVIYNVLAKSIPVMPKVLKRGSLSLDKGQSTTPELYRQAIAENGLNEADYAEFLAYLEENQKEYFYREYLTFSQEERGEWRRELWQIAADIERAGELDSFYRNTASCYGFGQCEFTHICEAPDKDFVIEQSYVKKDAHSELETKED